jgi:AcrR family transcriptional regulator
LGSKNKAMDKLAVGSAEERIKEAARKVFTEKGYAATRTRDIAEASGINLALLNYYFRSKEKLFEIIMKENIQLFVQGVKEILNNEVSSLRQKMELLVEYYIDMLLKHPHVPMFVISEMRHDPNKFVNETGFKNIMRGSVFLQQLQVMQAEKKQEINPVHFMINLLSLTVFPFMAYPMMQQLFEMDQKAFKTMMEERKQLIPFWIESIMNTK